MYQIYCIVATIAKSYYSYFYLIVFFLYIQVQSMDWCKGGTKS